VIQTDRLLLRPPTRDDDVAAFVADGHVQKWIGGSPEDPAEEVLERWVRRWEQNGIGQFLVLLGGEIIGRVGFIVWDGRTWRTSTYAKAGDYAETELGWAILSREWGHGYATEAAHAVRAWARDPLRIISLIDPRNVRSIRVADKLGAVPERLVDTDSGPTLVWVHPR
jgi:RimJ/RimL family protein N-acetyltransferase